MSFLFMISFIFWNAFVIKWDKSRTIKARQFSSDVWHAIGVVVRIGCIMIVFAPYLPDWYDYVINPYLLLPYWYGLGLSILTAGALTYWLYNTGINLVNKWDWDFVTKVPIKLYRISTWIFLAITLLFIILGGIFIKG